MKTENAPGRIKKTRWFICLLIWWVAAVFFYLFIAAQENNRIDRVTAAGIKVVLLKAEQAGLPLLEQNVPALTRLAKDVATVKGVVNVSIIDHKNKIIAFTNPDQLLAMSSKTAKQKEGVSYWLNTLDDGTRAVCLSSDIIYAGTKIGEIFLAMNASGSVALTTVFFLSALVSLLMIVFILLVQDFQGVDALRSAMAAKIRAWSAGFNDPSDDREMICPLCGSHKPLSRAFMLQANLERFTVVRPGIKENGPAQMWQSRGVNLRELSRRDDLGWFRRQMINRCADIIKKLSGD